VAKEGWVIKRPLEALVGIYFARGVVLTFFFNGLGPILAKTLAVTLGSFKLSALSNLDP